MATIATGLVALMTVGGFLALAAGPPEDLATGAHVAQEAQDRDDVAPERPQTNVDGDEEDDRKDDDDRDDDDNSGHGNGHGHGKGGG